MRSVMLFALIAQISVAVAKEVPDTYGNRIVVAEEYLSVVPMEKMIEDAIRASAANSPNQISEEQISKLLELIDVGVLERAALASMVKHFTVKELSALKNFYGSEEGKSAMAKFGDYMGDVMPIMNAEMTKVLKELGSN